MLFQNQIDTYAQKILDDYDAVNPSTIFKENIKMSNEDAHLIQSAVTSLREKRGEEVIGYKIGCVSKQTQIKMGFTQPAWGRLWKNELHPNGSILKKINYANPAMEAEFGIILDKDINSRSVTFEDILDSIASIHPIIEIHNLVYNGEPPHGVELLANNAIHAGVVIGDPIIEKKYSQVTDLKLKFDGEVIDNWSDKKWPNDILSELGWLIEEQSKIGNTLKKGDLILTGAFGLPVPINDKEFVEVKSSLFGNVSALFKNE